jgi:ABC-type dipeptide/oligopeptide/nickel transport system permease subunit
MDRISKTATVFLTLIVAVSCLTLLTVKPTNAQSIPKPSVPVFTSIYMDLSYDVPSTTYINQYTGQTETNQGYHVENRTLQVIIKNQPFTSYVQNRENISFYYNIREKGAYVENWTTLFRPDNYNFWAKSNTDYTTFVFLIDQNASPLWDDLVNGGTIDFQVQAMTGYASRTVGFASGYFNGTESEWSSTQSVTVPTSSVSSSPSSVPAVSILSPAGNSSFDVVLGVVGFQLIYKASTALSWVGYSIDAGSNVTVSGNSTYVQDVENTGYHTFTLYANDNSGNWATPQTVTYRVTALSDATSQPSQSLFSAEIIDIVLGVFIAAIVVASLLVYFKKLKH